jgi:hypothetical protein
MTGIKIIARLMSLILKMAISQKEICSHRYLAKTDAVAAVQLSFRSQFNTKSLLLRTGWRSWLRHCATNREVAGSIPDGVTGIFQ